MAKQLAEQLRNWIKDGWTATKTKGGHWRLTHPEVSHPIFCPSTPSDWRSILNVDAMIKRARRPSFQPEKSDTATVKKKPKSRNAGIVFDLYGINTPRGFKRLPSKDEWVTDDDLAFDDTDTRLLAWSFAYMRLRAEGHDISVIRTLRQRFKTDEDFRNATIKKFEISKPEDFEALRRERRLGVSKTTLQFPLTIFNDSPHKLAAPSIQDERQYSIALRAKLEEAEKALDAERTLRCSIERTLADNAAAFQKELIEMRTKKNQAEAVRNDMEQQLLDAKEKLKQERVKNVADVSEGLEPVLKHLADLLAQHSAAVDRRLSHIQELLDLRIPKKPQVEGLKIRPKVSVGAPQQKTIGERIKNQRKALGLSQTSLGQTVGTSGTTISFWENNRSQVSEHHLRKLAKALKVSEHFLLNG